ncbi:hypothetical protein T45_04250 [Streptomyces turgidiscabies]|nr:hypothetical protein T45_04250 [Streptomyces turgidiscabies]
MTGCGAPPQSLRRRFGNSQVRAEQEQAQDRIRPGGGMYGDVFQPVLGGGAGPEQTGDVAGQRGIARTRIKGEMNEKHTTTMSRTEHCHDALLLDVLSLGLNRPRNNLGIRNPLGELP